MRQLSVLVALGLILQKGRASRSLDLPDLPQTKLVKENISLRQQVEELQNQVDVLRADAAVRESFIGDLMERQRCPDCERPRGEWY